MFNRACGLQFAHVSHELAVHNPLELLYVVHVVNDAQLYMVGSQTCKQILERRTNLIHIARTNILAALPRRPDMALINPAIGAAP